MDARKEGGGDFWDPEVLSPDFHKRYGCLWAKGIPEILSQIPP